MIETGIAKLDEYIKNVPKGKSVLFSIEPGVEESNIALHVLHHNLKKGLQGVYVMSESSPKNLQRKFSEYGWIVSNYPSLTIVDGYSSLIGSPSGECFVVEEPHDIKSYEDVLLVLLEHKKDIKGNGIVVFDSLSNIMDMCGERETLDGIEAINGMLETADISSVYNFISWPYKEAIFYRMRRLFNVIIEVNLVEELISRQRMHVKKNDWHKGEGHEFEVKIFKPDGIRVFIPKVTVIGPHMSGKTSFIKALSKHFTPIERMGVSVGMEYGQVDYHGYRIDMFGIPGQEHFMPLIDRLGTKSSGIFLVIDSTRPHEFQTARRMLEPFKNTPVVIVANKQDIEGALNINEIGMKLSLPTIPIVPVSTVTGTGLNEALDSLIKVITENKNVG